MATRIAISGGPGAGKTTVWQAMVAEQGERIVAVPEVATLMLRHVFPPVRTDLERRALQRSIFRVQQDLEAAHAAQLRPDQVLLCDRGTPDGAGYWPEGHDAMFMEMATTWDAQLARYDAVIFLETAAAGGLSISSGNETRHEDLASAVEIDRRLRAVWSRHARFFHIGHERDFSVKTERALTVLRNLLASE